MKINTSDYRVDHKSKTKFKLKEWPTRVPPVYKSKEDYQMMLGQHSQKLADLQALLDANATYSVLLVLQAMDAAGKDSMIKHVMSGVNPQGCDVFSFKAPSSTELAHDFLWRTNKCLPPRGKIGIFNRSYYEEVLIARVHPEILAAQRLPPELTDKDTLWKGRFQSIKDMESHVERNGTVVIKIYLHISRDEQRNRFLARIDRPEKNWKITPEDITERKYWKEYNAAYEEAITATNTKECPWYIIPADDKPTARLIVSQILVEHLEGLHLSYPKTNKKRREELLAMRSSLEKDS